MAIATKKWRAATFYWKLALIKSNYLVDMAIASKNKQWVTFLLGMAIYNKQLWFICKNCYLNMGITMDNLWLPHITDNCHYYLTIEAYN